LTRNALDATEARGELVHIGVANHGGRLSITVRDRGDGMPPHVRERAGEPFFTTKDPGRGMGLGLFLTRVFAERLGGSLTLDTSEGTTARLDLPLPLQAGDSA
jgi:two-component system sensor histidine kinase RegB